MSAQSARLLVGELRRHGIELAVSGDRLRYRPRDAMTAELVERARRHKADIIATLGATAIDPFVMAVLEAFPGSELVEGPDPVANSVEVNSEPLRPETRPCRACGSRRWWRRREGGPWVCGRCHSPGVDAELLEWQEVTGA